MKIELVKITDNMGEVYYHVKVDGTSIECKQNFEEAETIYFQVKEKAQERVREVIHSCEIIESEVRAEEKTCQVCKGKYTGSDPVVCSDKCEERMSDALALQERG